MKKSMDEAVLSLDKEAWASRRLVCASFCKILVHAGWQVSMIYCLAHRELSQDHKRVIGLASRR